MVGELRLGMQCQDLGWRVKIRVKVKVRVRGSRLGLYSQG